MDILVHARDNPTTADLAVYTRGLFVTNPSAPTLILPVPVARNVVCHTMAMLGLLPRDSCGNEATADWERSLLQVLTFHRQVGRAKR